MEVYPWKQSLAANRKRSIWDLSVQERLDLLNTRDHSNPKFKYKTKVIPKTRVESKKPCVLAVDPWEVTDLLKEIDNESNLQLSNS